MKTGAIFGFLLLCFSLTAAAGYETQETQESEQYIVYDFLDEFELTLDEYILIAKDFEMSGTLTHRLQGLEERYVQFHTQYPELTENAAIAYVNANADYKFYTEIQPVYETDSIIFLVNKHHQLPMEYVPENLVEIIPGYSVREETAEQFWLMQKAAKEDGVKIGLTSAYRSYNRQRQIHNSYKASYGLAYTDRSVSRPGHSEHQAGLAIDFARRNTDWLVENGYKYGFILRYPDEYEQFTGVRYEPWHWRFVGIEIAEAMRSEGIPVYEEFYGKYLHPDVLGNTATLIYEKRAFEAEQERLRLEAEAAEQERLWLEEQEKLLRGAIQNEVVLLQQELVEITDNEGIAAEIGMKVLLIACSSFCVYGAAITAIILIRRRNKDKDEETYVSQQLVKNFILLR